MDDLEAELARFEAEISGLPAQAPAAAPPQHVPPPRMMPPPQQQGQQQGYGSPKMAMHQHNNHHPGGGGPPMMHGGGGGQSMMHGGGPGQPMMHAGGGGGGGYPSTSHVTGNVMGPMSGGMGHAGGGGGMMMGGPGMVMHQGMHQGMHPGMGPPGGMHPGMGMGMNHGGGMMGGMGMGMGASVSVAPQPSLIAMIKAGQQQQQQQQPHGGGGGMGSMGGGSGMAGGVLTVAQIKAMEAAKKAAGPAAGAKPGSVGKVMQAAGKRWRDATLDEWPENDHRIFVGDLGNEVTDDNLAKAFNKYTSFAKAKIVRDPRTHKSKGFGFVSFLDSADFAKALREMQGKYIGNRPCKLTKSSWDERAAPTKGKGKGGGNKKHKS